MKSKHSQIKALASRISAQKEWQSPLENWEEAEKILSNRPWRAWVIRFTGNSAKSGWDWLELGIKVSIPFLVVAVSATANTLTSRRQEIASQIQEDWEVAKTYYNTISEIVGDGKSSESTVNIVGAWTLGSLSQISPQGAYKHKGSIIKFLIDATSEQRESRERSKTDRSQRNHYITLVDLSEADLSGANLKYIDLDSLMLDRADLHAATIEQSYFMEAHLSCANLGGSKARNSLFNYADLHGAVLDKANLGASQIRGANLRWALMRGVYAVRANLEGADLMRADLRGSNLAGASFNGASLYGAVLSNVNLFRADLSGSDLIGADLRGANFKEANLNKAKLLGTDLLGANLTGANLEGAVIDKDLLRNAYTVNQPLVSRLRVWLAYNTYRISELLKHGLAQPSLNPFMSSSEALPTSSETMHDRIALQSSGAKSISVTPTATEPELDCARRLLDHQRR